VKSEWELSSYQDLVSFWFWFWLDMRSEALISQRFNLISSYEKNFDFISQEKASILILFCLISWLLDLILQEKALILILFYLISWKTDLILWKYDLILISSHLISQKHDFISVLTWNQNEMRYLNLSLVIQTIWCRKSRKYYQVILSMLIIIIILVLLIWVVKCYQCLLSHIYK